jgi:hypothetical protein
MAGHSSSCYPFPLAAIAARPGSPQAVQRQRVYFFWLHLLVASVATVAMFCSGKHTEKKISAKTTRQLSFFFCRVYLGVKDGHCGHCGH